jgi:hypothetical protein
MKPKLFATLRLLAAAALIVTVALGLAGKKAVVSDTPFETVLSAVTGKIDLSEMQEGDHQMFRRLYGLSPADYEECALYFPNSNMGAEELLLVKLRDPADAAALTAAAEQRIKNQINVFDGYGPAQVALLKEHARIEAPGNYFLFVVSGTADAAVNAFREVL